MAQLGHRAEFRRMLAIVAGPRKRSWTAGPVQVESPQTKTPAPTHLVGHVFHISIRIFRASPAKR